ncbi:MAG: ABC transporter ATP-binding protein [Phycisphaerae bacterium]|nr:ABC transporter ATP-binding protein [Phycisphaerae bacterium]
MPIEAEHLSVTRGRRTVVQDVSLGVEPGRVLNIVGPNGAGKSTLMLALCGYLPPATGHVRLDGRSIRSMSRRAVGRRIAYVPQTFDGFAGFRVRDVLDSARFAHRHPLAGSSDDDDRIVREEMDACEITALDRRALASLSVGERQKVLLAAAFVQRTDYLLLDEPTHALDPRYLTGLVRLLREHVARGRALIVICHDLNVAAALGGDVLALRDGRCRFHGPLADLLCPERLSDVFDTSFVLTGAQSGGNPYVSPAF